MTAQASDGVEYMDETWTLSGIDGGPLFQPAKLGLKPVSSSSGCWRGFVCTYAIRDRRLVLDTVRIHLQHEAPALYGRTPRRDNPWFSAVYEDLDHDVPFTGRLVLGRNFIRGLHVNMGFPPSWKFEHVVSLELQEGHLTRTEDVSEEMATRREKNSRHLAPAPDATEDQIRKWISRTFSRRP